MYLVNSVTINFNVILDGIWIRRIKEVHYDTIHTRIFCKSQLPILMFKKLIMYK